MQVKKGDAFQPFDDLAEVLEKIKAVVIEKNDWIERKEICRQLGFPSNINLVKGQVNTKMGQLLYNHLRKQGFQYKKVDLDELDKYRYEIWIGPPSFSETITNIPHSEETDQSLVLACVETFNGLFGINGFTKILKGSSSLYNKFYYEEACASVFFGALRGYRCAEIERSIKSLIEENKLIRTDGFRPVLRIAKKNYEEVSAPNPPAVEKISLQQADLFDNQWTREAHEAYLKTIWGFSAFHDNQWAVLEKIFAAKRVLIIEKTGFGKSLCYQYASNVFYEQGNGLTLVFSPLLSLMRDQVERLKQIGIKAACINSEQEWDENREILERAKSGDLAILYIAPERLENDFWQEYVPHIKLSMIVIDEAHCISTWGHDFRPSYRRILTLVKNLPAQFPVLAVTATATNSVATDIKEQIGEDMEIIRGELFRANLNLNVILCESEEERMQWILRIVRNVKVPQSLKKNGLLYCGRVADTVIYAEWLRYNGIHAAHYSSRIGRDKRKEIETAFFNNEYDVIASTNALGMGVDKPDVRFLIHAQIPENPISYYQEIGRAGRDNHTAQIVLLYHSDDKALAEYFIENSRPMLKKYHQAVNALKKSPLTLIELANTLYLRDDKTDTLINDLIDQHIAIKNGSHYEYKPLAPPLDEDYFYWQKQAKLKQLNCMIDYIHTTNCRMAYLCHYLGDKSFQHCHKCDRCKKFEFKLENNAETTDNLTRFLSDYYLEETISLGSKKSTIIAMATYGNMEIGKILQQCKYEKHCPLPQELVETAATMMKKHFPSAEMLVYVPPTKSGELVADFARRLGEKTGLLVSQKLTKKRPTELQKAFKSRRKKKENLKDAFDYISQDIEDKNVVIIDDIIDSGVTIEVVADHLYKKGAKQVDAFVIAKTIKGDD